MTLLVVLTVVVIVLLIAGLAFYLFWAGTLLSRVASKLEGAAGIVHGIVADAEQIGPGVSHINESGAVVAGALPLLYTMAEGIVAGVTPKVPQPRSASGSGLSSGSGLASGEGGGGPYGIARPASGTRRSRLLGSVGYRS